MYLLSNTRYRIAFKIYVKTRDKNQTRKIIRLNIDGMMHSKLELPPLLNVPAAKRARQ